MEKGEKSMPRGEYMLASMQIQQPSAEATPCPLLSWGPGLVPG